MALALALKRNVTGAYKFQVSREQGKRKAEYIKLELDRVFFQLKYPDTEMIVVGAGGGEDGNGVVGDGHDTSVPNEATVTVTAPKDTTMETTPLDQSAPI